MTLRCDEIIITIVFLHYLIMMDNYSITVGGSTVSLLVFPKFILPPGGGGGMRPEYLPLHWFLLTQAIEMACINRFNLCNVKDIMNVGFLQA